MNSVEQILEVTQFKETIDGIEFVLRPVTAEVAATVIGTKTLGLIGGGGGAPKDIPTGEIMGVVAGYLEACMVSPKIGEVSDPLGDTITVADLGEFAGKILSVVFERSGFERVGNSEVSFEGIEEGT